MLSIIGASITAVLVCALTIPEVCKVFIQKRIFDEPGGRKIHKKVTPSMGGVAIIFAFLLGVVFWLADILQSDYHFLIGALLLILFVGIRDDMLPLSPRNKLIFLISSALIVTGIPHVTLKGLYTLDHWGVIGELPDFISISLTVFVIITLTNSFNLIDGIDGLAGTIGSIPIFFISVWLYFIEEYTLSGIAFTMGASIVTFLFYNWSPAKLFMGDAGALTIGFFISVLLLIFLNLNHELAKDSFFYFEAEVSTTVCLFIYPIFDTARVFMIRISQGRSPFSADKLHIHHILTRTGLTHGKAVLLILSVSLFYASVPFLLGNMLHDLILIPIIILSLIGLEFSLRKRVSYYQGNQRRLNAKALIA